PMEAIIDSVEAMRFMAENKGVSLRLEMSGILNQQGIEGSTADKIDTYNNVGFEHGKPDNKIVQGNSIQLKQVVNNLLSNAIKYTDIGEVVVSAKLDQHILTVSVRDSGSGIPRNQQSKLFSAYYQPVGSKAGTGLGLYLCRQLVQLQGGTISLESDEGKGCTVTFSIPYDV
ncbi:MAG: ATP-binding protein, partial [Pedobacter sp.]